MPALAICVIALGILERDSLWIALGTLLGLVSLLIVVGVVYALVKSALYLLVNTFA
ncbi:exopolysaccharide biosynthesis protein [Halovulum dunhuangense]|uniref:exopolysaccharide biosynthesis protein n=1 Tax=Halovulum dunhuangense TaxID=1505036 RepID=UPI0031B6265D